MNGTRIRDELQLNLVQGKCIILGYMPSKAMVSDFLKSMVSGF